MSIFLYNSFRVWIGELKMKKKYTEKGELNHVNAEDFADSVMLFKQMGEERFKRKYPNRYKILKEKGY